MAKVDGAHDPSFYMNPAAFSQVKSGKSAEEKKTKNIRGGKTEFKSLFDNLRGKTTDELGPLSELPVSEETVNLLMDEVRSAGDTLKSRPLPEEIMRYKQAVRNFINYVVKNNYSVEVEAGIPKFLKPGFKGARGTPDAMDPEDLAAMLLSGQAQQMQLVSRLEEIRGLLVDLLQ